MRPRASFRARQPSKCRHRGDSTFTPAAIADDAIAATRAGSPSVIDLLGRVRLDETSAFRFPSGLSGGERQRAAIARAFVTAPDVLVCDEITSALDVSVQAAIIELLATVRRELGTAMLFVTHDIALAHEVADRIAVLRDGRIVEQGTVAEVLANPRHEYTR